MLFRPPAVAAVIFLACSALMTAALAQGVNETTPGYFAWSIPSLDNSATYVDMGWMNEQNAGAAGRVRIQDGHFVDAANKRIRFLGTNVTFEGALPPKNTAPAMAEHLKRMGFNLVRFHHLDTNTAPRGILKADKVTLDATALDRMDYFINELQKRGIYINMNLHVGRNYPGLPTDIDHRFRYGKVLDRYYRPFINLQKNYARDLLTHVNPYTGKSLAQDPAVLVVELNNENSVFQAKFDELDALPDPFRTALLDQWHEWLTQKYATDEAMRQAWLEGLETPGNEMLANADFSNGLTGYSIQRQPPVGATATVEDGQGPDGSAAFHGGLTTPGDVNWAFQLHQLGLTLVNGRPYTFIFHARSPNSDPLNTNVMLSQSPYTNNGFNRAISLTPQWKRFEFTFTASNAQANRTRISFNFGGSPGEWWIDSLSLKPGHSSSVIDRIGAATRSGAGFPVGGPAPGEVRDFNAFLFETECNTVREIRDYLKTDLGVGAFINDTLATYGGAASTYRESDLSDIIDMHAYWQHPSFPNVPWDPIDWTIGNTPLTSSTDGGTMTHLARHRVDGMPFTVSEYNHPAPSFFAAQIFPIFSSFGSLQDWDAIYQFTYKNGIPWNQTRIDGHFTLDGHAGQLAFVPFAAVAFRQGCFTKTTPAVTLEIPADPLQMLLTQTVWDVDDVWRNAGAGDMLPVIAPVAIKRVAGRTTPYLNVPAGVNPSQDPATANPVSWQKGSDGIYKAVSSQAVALMGAVAKNTAAQTVGPFTVSFQPTFNNHAIFTAAALDGKTLLESSRVLVAIANRVENSDMGWNAALNSVGNQWGTAPTVAEGVRAAIMFAGNRPLTVSSLDGVGRIKQKIGVTADGSLAFDTQPQDQTLWYLIQPASGVENPGRWEE